MANEVSDMKAERGITISNVLQTLLLIVMGGVWNSVNDLRETVAEMYAVQSVNQTRIITNAEHIKELKEEIKEVKSRL